MAESTIEKSVPAGTVVSGGVFNISDPAADVLGSTPSGSAPLGGIEPTGSAANGVGILRPEQSRQFIEYLWNNMVWSNDGRRITLRANSAELEKMNVGERVIRAAAQADATYTNAEVTFSKIELTTRKVRLDWEVSTEALEDGIEGTGLEDHLVRSMTAQFAADLEDLAINADSSVADGFHNILGTDGFLQQYVTAQSGGIDGVDGSATSVEVFQNLIKAIPRKFRGAKRNLKFYASSNAFTDAVNGLGSTGSLQVQNVVQRVIDGQAPQAIGDPVRYSVLGVPLQEVPLLGEEEDIVILLTFPQNNIWGFQRDITVHNTFQPKKDTREYTVYARFGIAIEEPKAASLIYWPDGEEPA
jgi:HK97 family phage major capsid protein